MPLEMHTLEIADGSNNARQDRLLSGVQLAVANAAGAAGATVTTAVSFPAGSLPANYAVFVDAGQASVIATVSAKTTSGFNVVLTPLSGTVAVAASTFNVLVVG